MRTLRNVLALGAYVMSWHGNQNKQRTSCMIKRMYGKHGVFVQTDSYNNICLIDYIRLSVHVLLYGKGRHKAGLVRKKILYC